MQLRYTVDVTIDINALDGLGLPENIVQDEIGSHLDSVSLRARLPRTTQDQQRSHDISAAIAENAEAPAESNLLSDDIRRRRDTRGRNEFGRLPREAGTSKHAVLHLRAESNFDGLSLGMRHLALR